MNKHYLYDDIYGTLLHKNKDDTERVYFGVECENYNLYKWMFIYGWNKIRDYPFERNGLAGRKITLQRKMGD